MEKKDPIQKAYTGANWVWGGRSGSVGWCSYWVIQSVKLCSDAYRWSQYYWIRHMHDASCSMWGFAACGSSCILQVLQQKSIRRSNFKQKHFNARCNFFHIMTFWSCQLSGSGSRQLELAEVAWSFLLWPLFSAPLVAFLPSQPCSTLAISYITCARFTVLVWHPER